MSEKTYIAIDLKSFYASVECTERGLDPMTTNLVVADESRTEKTICLAVSPSLKAYGIPGRARLFEVVQRVKQVNNQRQRECRGFLLGESYDDNELKRDKSLAVSFIRNPQYRPRRYAVSAFVPLKYSSRAESSCLLNATISVSSSDFIFGILILVFLFTHILLYVSTSR